MKLVQEHQKVSQLKRMRAAVLEGDWVEVEKLSAKRASGGANDQQQHRSSQPAPCLPCSCGTRCWPVVVVVVVVIGAAGAGGTRGLPLEARCGSFRDRVRALVAALVT